MLYINAKCISRVRLGYNSESNSNSLIRSEFSLSSSELIKIFDKIESYTNGLGSAVHNEIRNLSKSDKKSYDCYFIQICMDQKNYNQNDKNIEIKINLDENIPSNNFITILNGSTSIEIENEEELSSKLTFSHLFDKSSSLVEEIINKNKSISENKTDWIIFLRNRLIDVAKDMEDKDKIKFYSYTSSLFLNVLLNRLGEFGNSAEKVSLESRKVIRDLINSIRQKI